MMIINNVKNLVVERGITPYRLGKIAGISPTSIRELMKDETIVPRKNVLNGICFGLNVNVGDVLIFNPNRVNTKSNKSMSKSNLKQNYLINTDYNILDVRKRLQEIEENNMHY